MKQTEIKFNITLDEQSHPEKIEWMATDSGVEGLKEAKAFMLSVWDAKDPGTLRIDLWNKDMMVEEMKRFVYDTMQSLASTYANATNDEAIAKEIRDFSISIGKKTGVIG
ncbi:MAG: gliding motility protein GldC [Bacteroidia bacterium]